MVRRIGSLVSLLLVATLVLAACGSEDDEVEPTVTRIAVEGAPAPRTPTVAGAAEDGEATQPPPAQGETGGEAAGPVTIDVEMRDVQFDKKEIRVPANTEITVNLVNTGVTVHNFNIDELNAQSGDYQAGQSGTLTFNSGAPGEYIFYCSIGGHRDAGMWGTLIVGEAEPPAAGSPAAAAPSPEAAPGGSLAAGATTLTVELVDIAFNPAELRAPANSEVTLHVTNTGVAPHTFTIPDLGVDTGELAPGQSTTLTFNSSEAGTYRFICTVAGHEAAGMVGALIVEGTPAAAGEASPAPAEASPAASPAASPIASPAPGGATSLSVDLVDIAFEPEELRVPANTEITLEAVNTGVAPHTFTIPDLGVDTGQVPAGQTATVTFNSGAPRTYQYICTIPGHEGAGMVGTLIVE